MNARAQRRSKAAAAHVARRAGAVRTHLVTGVSTAAFESNTAQNINNVEQHEIDLLTEFESAVRGIDARNDEHFCWAIGKAADLLHMTHQNIAEAFNIS